MPTQEPSVVVVRSPSIPVEQTVIHAWYRHSPPHHRLVDLELTDTDTTESLLRFLVREAARTVIFLGNTMPEAVVMARLSGMRVILAIDDQGQEAWHLGDWREPVVAAPFFAHLVVLIGDAWPTYHDGEDGLGWGAQYVVRDLGDLDLSHVVQMAESQRDAAHAPPVKASMFWHAQDELAIWRACRADRLDEESQLIRDRCLLDLKTRPGGAIYSSTRLAPSERGRAVQRVLFVSHELSKTGAPTGMLWAMKGLLELEVDFELWCIGIGDGPMADDFRSLVGPDRFQVVEHDEAWPHYRTFLDAVDRIDPDILFLNASPVYALAPLIRWKGIPLVWWFHDGINVEKRDGHLFSMRSLEAMHRYALASADVVLTASRDTAEQLETFCPPISKPVGVVPYGFDVDALIAAGQDLGDVRIEIRNELRVPDDGTLFVCVGSLERRKNQKRLVSAFQSMLGKMPTDEAKKHALALVGRLDPDNAGPESYYHEILGALQDDFADQVHIVGPQPSGAPFMAAADCHVLISTNECSPLVNIESMLLETSVISSRVHGIPEVVLEGVRGRLVEPEDDANIEEMLTWFVRTRRESAHVLEEMRGEALSYARTNHDYVRTGSMVLETLQSVMRSESFARTRIVGEEANKALERELMIRWSWMKHDAPHSSLPLRERMHGPREANPSLP